MKKKVELPLAEPIYSTYNHHIGGTVVTHENPSLKNWYINNVMILCCNRKFLSGFTTPEINVVGSVWIENPYLDKPGFQMRFIRGYTNGLIRELINNGYYVYYHGVDDYYVEGKSWYKEKHIDHDGLIFGYDQEEKTYSIYAYDQNWICRPFKTSQKSFNAGRHALFRKECYGNVYGIKPTAQQIEIEPETIRAKLKEYLDSSFDKYPTTEEGGVYGIVVHDYIAMYLEKLLDGSIPYERMDRRVFRMIWEHKKAMLDRLQKTETFLGLKPEFSTAYKPLVAEADTMRMLYASHHMKRRDSVLPVIRKKLLSLKEKEQQILTNFIDKTGG